MWESNAEVIPDPLPESILAITRRDDLLVEVTSRASLIVAGEKRKA